MSPRSLAALPAACLAAFVTLSSGPHAQRPAEPLPLDRGSAGAWQALRRLQTRASLLHVTAHPDDEDGGMLTRESRGRGTRVELLCLTRGEGGANVMSDDYFDALGLVRTQELLAASRHYGARVWFGTVTDYGFSKTLEECLGQWTRERAVGDVVRIIRRTRPLVVTSVFNGTTSDGHGNHQATGQATIEAFRAAGDPNRFPEQIGREGLRPWAPLKLYLRVPRGSASPAHVTVASGDYDAVLGQSYAQVARAGLGEHKSQNGGIGASLPAASASRYGRADAIVPAAETETSFFDGIDTTLDAIGSLVDPSRRAALAPALERVEAAVREATASFSLEHPERSAPALARGLAATRESISRIAEAGAHVAGVEDAVHELRVKEEQFEGALVLALGLSASAVLTPESGDARSARGLAPTASAIGVPGPGGGAKLPIRVDVVNGSGADVRLDSLEPTAPLPEASGGSGEKAGPVVLRAGQPLTRPLTLSLPPTIPLTRPYFTRPAIDRPYYDLDDVRHAGWPSAPDAPSVTIALAYQGVPFAMTPVVQAVSRATGPGASLHPVALVPAVSVAISPRAGVVPIGARSFEVAATVTASVEGAAGRVRLELPAGWTASPAAAAFGSRDPGEPETIRFLVSPAAVGLRTYTIRAVAETGGREYREGVRTVGYPGLAPSHLYSPSTLRLSGVDLRVPDRLNVGYVDGSGDEVAACLAQVGVRSQRLSAADLAGGDLRRFDAIVLGVRAYAVREDLKAHNRRLLDYVNDGGVLVVQYNTPEFDHDYGPYPYKMGGDPEEVTDERSRVEILEPAHPLLAWPNRITDGDFDGWVEERGSKFLASWDARYTPLLSTSDEGQAPQKGGLLVARYGKGAWIYNAYAFYRQLPEGVPGAYRILVNLVSFSKNPAARR